MNSIPPAENLGIPVDIAAVEKQLVTFWKSTGDTAAAVRACSCNLVSFARGGKEASQFLPVLARISEWHPSRSITAFVEPDEPLDPPDMHAWISAQCSVPLSGGPQVCCEAITIAARHRARRNLPNVILSLLVPDLPIYLYWRSFRIADRDLIQQLARFSRLLIVDSHQSREDPQNRLQLLQFLTERPGGNAMRDLNWSRITAWRDLIAQFFDSPGLSRYAHEVSEVEIIRNLDHPGSIPTRTLLLTGWLASSLGWRRISAERAGDRWSSVWKSRNREVRVNFTGILSEPGQVPGINSVTLRAGSRAEFVVSVEQGSHCISAVAAVEGSRLTHSVPEELLDESSLLIAELSQTGDDSVFRAALTEAYELEKAFSQNH